jgi:hypothetical protein
VGVALLRLLNVLCLRHISARGIGIKQLVRVRLVGGHRRHRQVGIVEPARVVLDRQVMAPKPHIERAPAGQLDHGFDGVFRIEQQPRFDS